MSADFWTAERERLLAKLAEEGKSARDAGLIIGCTRNAILGRAHRSGVKFSGVAGPAPKLPKPPKMKLRRGPRSHYSPEQKAEARRLYRTGMVVSQICDAVGVPVGSIAPWFSDLPRRRDVKSTRAKSRELKIMALAAIYAGISGAAVARRLGFSEHSLKNWRVDTALCAEAQLVALQAFAEVSAEKERRAAEQRAEADLERARIDAVNAPIPCCSSASDPRDDGGAPRWANA
jgi:transposase-like protein